MEGLSWKQVEEWEQLEGGEQAEDKRVEAESLIVRRLWENKETLHVSAPLPHLKKEGKLWEQH